MVDNNNDDGKNVADEADKSEIKPFEQQAEQKETQPKDAYIGVDGQGYFFCKIHMTQHPWMIIGFLNDAIAQFRGMVVKRQQEMKAQREKLMGRSKGFFNLLKPK